MRRKSYFAFAVALMLCLALLVGCAGQTTKPTDTAKPATPSGTDTAPSGDKQDETEPGTSVDVAPIKLGGIGPLQAARLCTALLWPTALKLPSMKSML